MKKFFSFMILLLTAYPSSSQFTLYRGNSVMEFSGYVTTFYNYRFYSEGETDKKKNRFALDYAVFRMDGVHKKVWNYQLQINNAALFDKETSDGFIMQADVAYNTLNDRLSIDVGFNKVPFSRSSLIPNVESPFLQRPQMARGGVFNRRDAGVTLRYAVFNKLINLYAGAYTGMGPESLSGENDESGNLEWAGRAELSYPARYRHKEVDLTDIPLPVITVGFNARHAEKKTTSGIDYPYQTLKGKKLGYGSDVSAMWRGVTVSAEVLRFKMTPEESLLLYGKPTEYFMAGGVMVAINYYLKPLKSVLAVRYDEFNPHDLVKGDKEATLSFGYNYLFDSMRAAMKVHYFKRLKDEDAVKVWNEDQLRIALQLQF